ncbi:MAG TPA: right-handed parallel beta-helix repeat-containing protein, partial [Tepidisphaeraceae bacterium]|nr:right-handed parallel beta-helix repeat-containing protein [Tepidisphaeraceae bacterium]
MAQGRKQLSGNPGLYPYTHRQWTDGIRRHQALPNSCGFDRSHRLYAAEPLEQRLLLAVLYVDLNASGPLHDGSAWDSAYADLQLALTTAQSGDQIRIAAGTYKPTADADRTKSFQLKTGVALYGGYGGHYAGDPDLRDIQRFPTILSGDIGTPGLNTDNSYHVVVGSGTGDTAVLDGFVITAGNANGYPSPNNAGGGMYNASGSPTIRNCIFRGNSSSWYGGGMANDASSPRTTNCVFSNNNASTSGGGVYNVASSSPVLDNCTFSGNSANSGSAISYSSSSPTITNCIIWGNTSGSYQLSGTGTPTIAYCDIQGRVTGTGSIDADPQFLRNPSAGRDGKWATADDDYGDLRLRSASPAINVGNDAAVPSGIATDLAGNPRIAGSKVDLGAYEVPDLPTVSFTTSVQQESEDVGTATVTLNLSRSYPMPVTIPLLLTGTATLDSDYRLLSPNPIVFEPGSTSASIRIEIVNDTRYEPSETLTLQVGDPTNAWYGAITTHTITLVDDNHEPPIQVYVDGTARGANDGTSWADAYTSLQEAMQTAELEAVIWVAEGTYTPGTLRTDAFQLRSRVAIYGGFPDGGGTWQQRNPAANPTILSGEIGNPATNLDNSYH